eukprot:CAMPEP_0171151992 /NCGR_PEP_ID=MMETSP0766_2-20121228/150345_1 /TAXON_ID=439317 /ORGANISM="Gambierdiscus australes, Strain CAWD 149" /LENGTH=90 /DNA_ID=CAMNT_0011615905 /DNA_START=1172 /DNA_END=1445 /DNA_ORIENTATION=+
MQLVQQEPIDDWSTKGKTGKTSGSIECSTHSRTKSTLADPFRQTDHACCVIDPRHMAVQHSFGWLHPQAPIRCSTPQNTLNGRSMPGGFP